MRTRTSTAGRLSLADRKTLALARGSLDDAGESAIQTLLVCANEPPEKWLERWTGMADWRIHGDPFLDEQFPHDDDRRLWRARELHGMISADLAAIVAGTYQRGILTPVRISWTGHRDPDSGQWVIKTYAPQEQLDEFLDWGLFHALNTGRTFARCTECSTFICVSPDTRKLCANPGCHRTRKAKSTRRSNESPGAVVRRKARRA